VGTALVLVVDDHAHFRRWARRILEEAGFAVVEAASGFEAVAAVGELRPDAVLLDIQLPDLDGFAVASRLASAGHAVPVVFISSREARDYGDRLAGSRAAGFIAKDQLTGDRLRSILERP
jgi:CheY-like chemotaxis protein